MSQASQQWLNLASSEAADPATRPRLVVEHLKNPDTETIVAPDVPERILPSTVTTVPVTVTNTTSTDWPADMVCPTSGPSLAARRTSPPRNTDRAPIRPGSGTLPGRVLGF